MGARGARGDRALLQAVTLLFSIRRTTVADASAIARHRAEMFSDMGQLPPALYDPLVQETIARLKIMIPEGEYVGWLAAPAEDPATIVAGAGVQLRHALPHALAAASHEVLARGRQGIVLNVFTEKAWRKKGAARRLMEEMLAWAKTAGLDTLVLHAAPDGRHLYESLGFVQTNEMRFTGRL